MRPLTRRAFATLALTAMSGGVAGCWGRTPPLRVASHVWPGYEFMFLARHEGWLDQQRVVLVETPSASTSMDLYRRGEVHAAALTLDEALRLHMEGLPVVVVLVFNVSAGADQLIARADITDLSEIVGRSIAVETGALGCLMLNRILRVADLPRSAITVKSMGVHRQYEAWQKGEIDLAITYEPMASRLIAAGGRLLFDSRRIPNTIFDVLAVRTEALDRQAERIAHLIESHFTALRYFRRNRLDASYLMAERLGIGGSDVSDIFRGIALPDLNANRSLLTVPGGRVLHVTHDLLSILENLGATPERSELADFITSRFVEG